MKIAILANCQARPLATLLSEIQPDIEVSSIGIVHLIKDEQEMEYSEALATADVIIAQQVAANYPCQFVTTNRLREKYGDKVLSIINLYYAGYNPEIMYLRLQGGTLGGPLADYHLKSIVQSWGDGTSIADCIKNCLSIEYNQTLFAGVAEQSLLELGRRETETNISIVDFIKQHQSLSKLFHVMNHPTNDLLIEYAKRIVTQLGFPKPEVDLAKRPEYLGPFQLPSNPYSHAHLNIKCAEVSYYQGLKFEQPVDGSIKYSGQHRYQLPELVEAYYSLYDHHKDRVHAFLNR